MQHGPAGGDLGAAVAAALQAALERTGELPPSPRPEPGPDAAGAESSEPLDLLDTSSAPWLTDPELGVQWAESWAASHPGEPEPPADPDPPSAEPPAAEPPPVAQAPVVTENQPQELPPRAPRAPEIQQARPLPWEAAAVDPLPPRQRPYEPRSLERMMGLPVPVSVPEPTAAPTTHAVPARPVESEPQRTENAEPDRPSSRRAVTFAVMVGLTLGLIGGLVAYAVGPAVRDVYLTRYVVPVYELPPSLEGLRVVQVSDLHLPGSAEAAAAAAALVAKSKPDVLLLTGDILDDASPEALAALDRFLATAQGAKGTFAVAGEREANIHGPLQAAYDQHGVQLLTNEQATVDVGGARLVVSGFEGPPMAHPEIVPVAARGLKLEDLARRRVKIVMVHAPQLLSELSQGDLRDAAFIVAGHTLGGRLGLPSLLGGESRYRSGWYSLERTQLYVSNGVGTGRWRARLFAPAEVTRFTLRRAANTYATPTKDDDP